MIFTERTITVVNDSATINKPLILYRGDKNIELKITIAESQFKFRNNDASNVIETTDASYAQLVINTPYNSPIFSDVAVTKNGAVIFVITEAMIDEIREVGAYEIQIRLLDDNKQSRASIPPVSNAIEIREPIAIEDGSAVDSNAVNVAKVNRALTTTSAPLEAFDSQGNYIKKTWGDGDPITDAALNKMEAAIDGVNKKIGNNRSQIKEIVQDVNTSTEKINAIEKVFTNKESYINIWDFGENLEFTATGGPWNKKSYTITKGFNVGDELLFTIDSVTNTADDIIADLTISKDGDVNLNTINLRKNNKSRTIKVMPDAKKITINLFLSQTTNINENTKVSFKGVKLLKINNFKTILDRKNTDIFNPVLNLYDASTYTKGKSISLSDGTISDADNWAISDYIKVEEKQKYYKKYYGSVAFYDKDKIFLTGVNTTEKSYIYTPTGCVYVRLAIVGVYNFDKEIFALADADHTFYTPVGTQYIKNELIDYKQFYKWYGKKMVSFGHSIVGMNRWQDFVSEYFGMLHTNCGQGGSTVAGEPFIGGDGETKIPLWKDERINSIPEDTDLILILSGKNDYEIVNNGKLGDINTSDTNTFYGAYKKVIEKLYIRCPNARVVIMTDLFRAYQSGMNEDIYEQINTAIREIAKYYNYPLIDCYDYGFNQLNYTVFYEKGDAVHPSYVGGKRMADVIIGKLKELSPYYSELN